MRRLLAPLTRRLRIMVSRAVINLVNDGQGLQELQLTLLAGEEADGVERIQEYGFTSAPKAGAEAVALAVGGSRAHTVVIATDDRRYRIKGLASGEVAIYDDHGQVIKLARDGIRIVAPNGLHIDGDVTVTGDLIASDISLVNHTHGGIEPGGGTTGAPNP
ncbi:MAG: phage baseplate assembly protein V [Candidatus Sedimenticola sp. (ex Thyasira tokunagai)]